MHPRSDGRRSTQLPPRFALVAEIGFAEGTCGDHLLQPASQRLREDETAKEIAQEISTADASAVESARAHAPRKHRPVKLTHPDKLLFPKDGITKRDLADYWVAVADWALPQLAGRPLSLYRCPDGHEAQCFYQKHIGIGMPQAVPRVVVTRDEDLYAMVDSLPALLALVQMGTIELHTWGSRVEHLEQPDIIVVDLDPAEDLAWRSVVDAAFDLKSRLESLGLVPFVRLTGGKGLHVVVPVEPGPKFPAVKRFVRTLAAEMARDEPKRYTASMAKTRRSGKVFLDVFRNERGATAIASYSPRARAGAPVALPIEWDALETTAGERPAYGVRDVRMLVRRRRHDPWEGFDEARRSLSS